jgi:molybdate transport system substrate-binding protein
MRRALRRALRAALVGLLVLAGPAGAEEILVAAAVSLREPLREIGERFERVRPGTRVGLSFGASSVLAAQVRAGAPIDLLVAADERIIDALEAENLVARRLDVAGNRIVVIQASGAAPPLVGPDDLARPGLRRIAVPAHAVPVGRYAREWLALRGLLESLEPRIVQTEHARATLAAVDAGDADAAIAYATDARLARSAHVAFEVPAAEQPRIVYTAARVAEARHPEGADLFLAFLGGHEAREVLAAAGFSAPAEGRR